ncbi:hypothetical protein ACJ41O_003624 [Fusarium nematophilum]
MVGFLALAGCIGVPILLGSVSRWWPGLGQLPGPILNTLQHQGHKDDICGIYHLVIKNQPGLAIPPDLYVFIGVPDETVKRYRLGDCSGCGHFIDTAIWDAVAGDYDDKVVKGVDARDIHRELFLKVSRALLDHPKRSVYDGTFWPALERLHDNKRGEELRKLCGWEEDGPAPGEDAI